MTTKPLENVIRELQRTVATLVSKVDIMETKITEQNNLLTIRSKNICHLCGRKDDSSLKVTRQSLPTARASTSAPATAPAPAQRIQSQRPTRQAKTAAIASMTKPSSATRKRDESNSSAGSRTNSKPDESADRRAPEDTRLTTTPVVAAKTAPAPLMNDSPLVTDSPLSTLSFGQHSPQQPELGNEQLDDDDKSWKQVTYKKNKRAKNVVVGTGQCDDTIRTIPQLKYIQAWSFEPDTTPENILKFLNKIEKTNDYFVQRREINSNRHASFIIGIPVRLFEHLTSPAVWPAGVKFSNWFLVRPRRDAGRGAVNDGPAADQH